MRQPRRGDPTRIQMEVFEMNFRVVGLGLLIIFNKVRVGGLDGSRDIEGLLSPPLQILDQMVSQDRAE